MKINLAFGQQSILSDHITINLLEQSPNLDSILENAECESIVADDVIGFYPGEAVAPLIDNWVSKLRKKGVLVVGGIDVGEVSRQFFNKNISLTDFNSLIYGGEPSRRSALTAYELAKALRGLGLKILKQRIDNFHYIVVAERS